MNARWLFVIAVASISPRAASADATSPADAARAEFARQQVARIAARLSMVRLVLAPDARVDAVSVDGSSLRAAAFARPFPLDPGEHQIALSAAGKTTRVLRVAVASAPGTQDVRVDALEDARHLPPPVAPAAPLPPAGPHHSAVRQTVGFVALGVGVAALGAGSVFGVRALSSKHDGDAHCAGAYCDAEGLALQADARTQAMLSTVGFGVAIAALGASALLLLTSVMEGAP
jgi:hypothetical protein